MTARVKATIGLSLMLLSMCGLTGCHFGVSQNPSYFPWLLPTGDIIPNHARPPGRGYYANFDPYAVRLEVRPLSQVNPVRTQHVIVATVYSDNKPLRKRRVEWYLEGKGNIIQVDESGFFPARGYQKDSKFAVSHTNFYTHRITRGNNDPRDDFELRPGQSWCVVSSAVEGDTYVTVVAPGIHNWDQRKVTVNIKWVDAHWQFPGPAQKRTGTQHVFNTRIFRFTDKQPLSNYKVRYRIVDGPPAVFVPNQTQQAVVVSDLDGNAQVAIAQQGPELGINKVEIDIIRPPDPTNPSGSGVPVAKSFTTIEWLAPRVEMSHVGPPRVSIGQEAAYTIRITNTGKIETQAITATNAIPEGFAFVRSSPYKAIPDGNNVLWTLSPLEPGQSHEIQTVFRALRTGTIRNCASVSTLEGLRDEKCVVTEVTKPGLRVDVKGPATGVVGVPLTFDVTLSNPGTGPATNLLLKADLSKGLEPQGVQPGREGARTITSQQQPLAPGESRVVPLTVVPRETGQQSIRVNSTADGGMRDSAEGLVLISKPQLDVKITGPDSRYTGRRAEWNIRVINPSNVPINNVTVRDQLPAQLVFENATDGGAFNNGEVVWDLGTLPPGGERVVQLATKCGNAPGSVDHRVLVTSDFGLREEDVALMNIKAVPAALALDVSDTGDPAAVGKRVTYEIEVTNTGSKPAKNVQIVTKVPNQMKPVFALGSRSESQITGKTVSFNKIAAVAPGETVKFKVEVEALKAGDVRFEARLLADVVQGSVVQTESTTIVDPNAAFNNPGGGQSSTSVPGRGVSGDNSPILRRPVVAPISPPPIPKKN